MCGQC